MEGNQIKRIKIKKITHLQQKENVYDINVDQNHNFFANGLLVHNCGEQLLPIGGVCLLGSINLTKFVNSDANDFDYEELEKLIPVAIRFMDNVNDKTHVPLEIEKENLINKRRIGLGILGYGSALMMMKMKYGSKDALRITEKLMNFIMNKAYQSSALLSKEKGSFKLYDEEKYLNGNFVKNLSKETLDLIKKHGLRNSHLLSVQPTGNTSILANVVSGGLEPLFMPVYSRTTIMPYPPEGLNIPKNIDWENKKFESETKWEWIKEGDENLLKINFNGHNWKYDKSRGLLRETIVKDYAVRYLEERGEWKVDAPWAATTTQLSIDDHIKTMEVIAKYIDSAMSKTTNIPNEFPFEEFKKIYINAYKTKVIKGCTTYRAGTMTEVLGSADKSSKSDSVEKITKTNSPKRPKVLNCDIHHITADGEKWLVIVGLLGDDPYEVFSFKPKKIHLPPRMKSGKLIRQKSGYYNLEIEDMIFEDVSSNFETGDQESVTRLISAGLRHGIEAEFIIDQLTKSPGSIVSFSKSIGRALKKYVNEQKLSKKCDNCGSHNVSIQEGCYICMDCSNSKCS